MIETIITATVVAAFISGLYSLIKSCVDNRAKRNDAITLFKYTKLYEIISHLHSQNKLLRVVPETGEVFVDLDRIKNLQTSYALAKPFLDPKGYNDFSNGFDKINKLSTNVFAYNEAVLTSDKRKILNPLIEASNEMENKFEVAVHNELARLLNK